MARLYMIMVPGQTCRLVQNLVSRIGTLTSSGGGLEALIGGGGLALIAAVKIGFLRGDGGGDFALGGGGRGVSRGEFALLTGFVGVGVGGGEVGVGTGFGEGVTAGQRLYRLLPYHHGIATTFALVRSYLQGDREIIKVHH